MVQITPLSLSLFLVATFLWRCANSQRIVGGRPATPGEVPYQLTVFLRGQYECGASLVIHPVTSAQIVLTAAHCISTRESNPRLQEPLEFIRVQGGSVNKFEGQSLQVSKVEWHPNWKGQFDGDIAILFLSTPFELSKDLAPIELPEPGFSVDVGSMLVVSGFGATGNSQSSNTLNIVEVPVVDNAYCGRVYKEIFQVDVINSAMICAEYSQGGKDSCHGDSGGPAVYKGTLVGVTNGGYEECAQPGYPGVYAKVTEYLTWIRGVQHRVYNQGELDTSDDNSYE